MRAKKQQAIKHLQKHGLSYDLAERVHKRYGSEAESVLRANPYQLLYEFSGTRWQTVEEIARNNSFPLETAERQQGAIYAELIESESEGHTWTPRSKLLQQVLSRLVVHSEDGSVWCPEVEELEESYESLLLDRLIVEEELKKDRQGRAADFAVQLPVLRQAEETIARRIQSLLVSKSRFRTQTVTDEDIEDVERDIRVDLAKNQSKALASSLTEKVSIITGGPGTGKTTILRGVIRLWEKRGARLRLAAPTGRAAKRLSESTRRSAVTIHRLLEYQVDTGCFARNAIRPLKLDLLIVDEASMIDTHLMAALLEAIQDRAHLLLVGDVNQLPSVGAGTVLDDLLACGYIPTIRLSEIFRQSEGSLIAINAQHVHQGQEPILDAGGFEAGQDFFFIERRSMESVVNSVLELVGNRIPEQFGLSPVSDVQVLVPMHKGQVGVENLNNALQSLLRGPDFREQDTILEHEGRAFTVGDKVMQTKNDYARDIFNGDLGIVTEIEPIEEQLIVSIDGRDVLYEKNDLYDLALAYAMTIHKSQGSEYPAVVIPLVMAHRRMLQRNLLYTAISRGKRLVILIGSRRAVEEAIANDRVIHRRTLLGERISQSFGENTRNAFPEFG